MALEDAAAFAVAHWSLDEASGSRVDSIGGLVLTDNNTVGSAAGMFGNAADFERSSSEYLSIADNATLSMGDIDFVIRCWVKLESKPGVDMQIWTKFNFSGSSEYRLTFDAFSKRFLFNVSNNGSSLANLSATNFGEPSLDTWYLIHCWHDSVANLLGISVNAGTANTSAHTTGVFDGTAPFGIGGNAALATQMFDGMVDDLVILKGYILSAAERTEDYNGGTGIAFEDWDGAAPAPTSRPFFQRPHRVFTQRF